MSVILIQSNHQSSSGTCSVTIGTPVTFTVVSGISAGVYITYEWYLNNTLVNIGTGYTLSNPQQNDDVYVKILNCMANVTDLNEDISFYYNDITPGVPQTYYLDLNASFDYRVISAVLMCDSNMYDVEIQIDGTPVVWPGSATSIDILTYANIFIASSLNEVTSNSIVTLVTTGTSSATLLQGKLRVVRTY